EKQANLMFTNFSRMLDSAATDPTMAPVRDAAIKRINAYKVQRMHDLISIGDSQKNIPPLKLDFENTQEWAVYSAQVRARQNRGVTDDDMEAFIRFHAQNEKSPLRAKANAALARLTMLETELNDDQHMARVELKRIFNIASQSEAFNTSGVAKD